MDNLDNKSKKFELIIARLKRKLLFRTDKELAYAIGMSPTAFNGRKKTASIPYPEIIDYANCHNLDLNDLLASDGPNYNDTTQTGHIYKDTISDNQATSLNEISMSEKQIKSDSVKKTFKNENGVNIPQWDNPDPEMYHYVPMARAVLNAGGGSFVLSENITGRYYAFRKHFLTAIASSPKNLILMKVTGDSMEPKIEDGDTVMIDVGKRQIKNGAIYALGYDDVIVIKEIEKLPEGKALIISKNRKMYPPYETDIRNIRIIGQVIWGDRIFVK